jgi:hypothetical protein
MTGIYIDNKKVDQLRPWEQKIIQSIQSSFDTELFFISVGNLQDDLPQFDIILNLSASVVPNSIVNNSTYGVLKIQYLGGSIYDYPIGLYEVINKREVIEIETILILSKSSDCIIIERAVYNPHWSVRKNKKVILNDLYTLVNKSLYLILNKIHFEYKTYNYSDKKNIHINYINHISYSCNFVKHLIAKIIILTFRIKASSWNIYVKKGNIFDFDFDKLFLNLSVEENLFYADPFLFEYNNELYVFFENYLEGKGIISAGKIIDDRIVDIVEVLNLDYHLSYPFIFEEDGQIFIIPECSENQKLEIYKCIKFPVKWELYSTGFDGEGIIDTVYYIDKENNKWLFLSKSNNCGAELYIYRIDSLKLNKIEPHKLNPVIIDARKARNGGGIFEYRGKTYRPSQYSSSGIYGKGIYINEIKTLTLEKYEEVKMLEILPEKQSKLTGMHHIHQHKEYFVFDVCLRQLNNKI